MLRYYLIAIFGGIALFSLLAIFAGGIVWWFAVLGVFASAAAAFGLDALVAVCVRLYPPFRLVTSAEVNPHQYGCAQKEMPPAAATASTASCPVAGSGYMKSSGTPKPRICHTISRGPAGCSSIPEISVMPRLS